MNDMILPENGSVVIVDNEHSEALPIIKALSKRGIAVTYYEGNNADNLPAEKKQIVRLLFLDLQLIETNDEHQISKHVTYVLNKIIPENNGPFILVVWSKNRAKYEATVIEELKKYKHLIPACIIGFNKRDCLEEKVVPSVDKKQIGEDLKKKLRGQISDEDIELAINAMNESLDDEFRTEYHPKANAPEIIEQHIKEGLKKAGVFHLFVIWENLVHISGSATIHAISDTIESTDLWEINMRDVIKRLAKARTGQNEVSKELALKSALETFSVSFSEELETSIRAFDFPEYVKLDSNFIISGYNDNLDKFEISEYVEGDKLKLTLAKNSNKIGNDVNFDKMSTLSNALKSEPDKLAVNLLTKNYNDIPKIVNTKLHIELNPSTELMPGNVYNIEVNDENKNKYLSTYFDNIDLDLSKYQFIELEVSPICDYAQKKWKKSRLLSGVIYNSDLRAKSNVDHLYSVFPSLLIENKSVRMIFDYHLFKSLDKEVVEKERKILFRLKRELLLDIVANLSGHINRPGISFMK